MFDAFTKVVAQADARGEFLNAGQIDALSAMVAESNKRMDAVNRITSNASKIVTNAARELFDQQPALIAPGGNAYTPSTYSMNVMKQASEEMIIDQTSLQLRT